MQSGDSPDGTPATLGANGAGLLPVWLPKFRSASRRPERAGGPFHPYSKHALTVERSEIANIQDSTLSLMAEGLLEALTPEQAQNLIAYLMTRSQVPLPESSKTSSN